MSRGKCKNYFTQMPSISYQVSDEAKSPISSGGISLMRPGIVLLV